MVSILGYHDLKLAVDQNTGIEGVYELAMILVFFTMIPIIYFISKQLKSGIFSMFRDLCFKSGDVVLLKDHKTKKMYAAAVLNDDSYNPRANMIYVTIDNGKIIQIPSSYIMRLLDNSRIENSAHQAPELVTMPYRDN